MRLLILSIVFITTCSFSQIESFEGYKSINGTKLYFKILAQPYKAKTGKGEPLLIVHGGPGFNHTYLLPHFKTLAKQYTLIFYDQRACGKSAIPSSDSVSMKFLVDDIDAIRKSFNLDKISILSHSWGAIPTVQYALDYPDRVKGIIFCNPVALSQEFDSMTQEEKAKRATGRDSTNRSIIIGSPAFKAGKADAYSRLIVLSFQHSFADEANLAQLKLELQDKFKDARQVLFTGLSKDLTSYNYYNSVQRFKFPVLILHGRTDVLPLRASEKMLESIPNSRLSIFRNSGHFIFIEEPKRFNQEVTAFSKMMNGSISK
jgi:proline iminopeptidase